MPRRFSSVPHKIKGFKRCETCLFRNIELKIQKNKIKIRKTSFDHLQLRFERVCDFFPPAVSPNGGGGLGALAMKS